MKGERRGRSTNKTSYDVLPWTNQITAPNNLYNFTREIKHGCIKPGSINNNRFFNKPTWSNRHVFERKVRFVFWNILRMIVHIFYKQHYHKQRKAEIGKKLSKS